MRNKNILFIFAALLLLSDCRRKEEQVDWGYEYFPLAKGNYIVYGVSKFTYSLQDTIKEAYQIKELVADTFTINGEHRYRIERYKRNTDSDPWPATPDSVWSAFRTNSKAIRTENNIRYIKLVFPLANGKTWNGNAENDLGPPNLKDGVYTYSGLGNPYQVLSRSFPGTVQVIQSRNDSDIVEKDYRMEVYAKNIGMIYKVKEQYSYDQSFPYAYRIATGIRYYEQIISYGTP